MCPIFWSVNFLTPYKVFGVLQGEMKQKMGWVAESSRLLLQLVPPLHRSPFCISNVC